MPKNNKKAVCDIQTVSSSLLILKELESKENREKIKKLVDIYSALKDELRLKMLVLMLYDSICVKDMSYVLKAPQPTVSRNLMILENAGLLERRRRGKWIYYAAGDTPLTRAFRSVVAGYIKV